MLTYLAFENGACFKALRYGGSLAGFDRDLQLFNQDERVKGGWPIINFEPKIDVRLGRFAIVVSVLAAVCAGMGVFAGTLLGEGKPSS